MTQCDGLSISHGNSGVRFSLSKLWVIGGIRICMWPKLLPRCRESSILHVGRGRVQAKADPGHLLGSNPPTLASSPFFPLSLPSPDYPFLSLPLHAAKRSQIFGILSPKSACASKISNWVILDVKRLLFVSARNISYFRTISTLISDLT